MKVIIPNKRGTIGVKFITNSSKTTAVAVQISKISYPLSLKIKFTQYLDTR
mgnify:CR=1 FL=1